MKGASQWSAAAADSRAVGSEDTEPCRHEFPPRSEGERPPRKVRHRAPGFNDADDARRVVPDLPQRRQPQRESLKLRFAAQAGVSCLVAATLKRQGGRRREVPPASGGASARL